MREIQEAIRVLETKRQKLQDQRTKINRDIYIIEQSIESIRKATKLQRIRSVSYAKICPVCKEPFSAKVVSAMICSDKCRNKARDKGIKLIEGAQK